MPFILFFSLANCRLMLRDNLGSLHEKILKKKKKKKKEEEKDRKEMVLIIYVIL
jgi:hypothetical protein